MHAAMEKEENFSEYKKTFRVDESMIDRNRHLNNVVCVEWIQDIAIEHSDLTGGTQKMEELGAGWMIRTQHVEYKSQAFLDDEIEGTTWVGEYSKISTNRFSKFVRKSDGKEIFSAVTTWVLVDLNRGRPIAIPEELKNYFRKADNL